MGGQPRPFLGMGGGKEYERAPQGWRTCLQMQAGDPRPICAVGCARARVHGPGRMTGRMLGACTSQTQGAEPREDRGGHSTKLGRSRDPGLAPQPQADSGLWGDRVQRRRWCHQALCWHTVSTQVSSFRVASGGRKAVPQVHPEKALGLFKDAK